MSTDYGRLNIARKPLWLQRSHIMILSKDRKTTETVASINSVGYTTIHFKLETKHWNQIYIYRNTLHTWAVSVWLARKYQKTLDALYFFSYTIQFSLKRWTDLMDVARQLNCAHRNVFKAVKHISFRHVIGKIQSSRHKPRWCLCICIYYHRCGDVSLCLNVSLENLCSESVYCVKEMWV